MDYLFNQELNHFWFLSWMVFIIRMPWCLLQAPQFFYKTIFVLNYLIWQTIKFDICKPFITNVLSLFQVSSSNYHVSNIRRFLFYLFEGDFKSEWTEEFLLLQKNIIQDSILNYYIHYMALTKCQFSILFALNLDPFVTDCIHV